MLNKNTVEETGSVKKKRKKFTDRKFSHPEVFRDITRGTSKKNRFSGNYDAVLKDNIITISFYLCKMSRGLNKHGKNHSSVPEEVEEIPFEVRNDIIKRFESLEGIEGVKFIFTILKTAYIVHQTGIVVEDILQTEE